MKNEHPTEQLENIELANKFEQLLGADKSDQLFAKLLRAMQLGGKKQAQTFLWNESDKFRSREDLIEFFEREVFDAGESRIGVETPWNMKRRMEARRK